MYMQKLLKIHVRSQIILLNNLIRLGSPQLYLYLRNCYSMIIDCMIKYISMQSSTWIFQRLAHRHVVYTYRLISVEEGSK